MKVLGTVLAFAAAAAPSASGQQYKVVGANDLGMHCIDREYSVFSILPPFNVVDVHVLRRPTSGSPLLLDDAAVRVTYEAVSDASGSANSTSLGKTQFWDYVQQIFHVALPPGQGLTGLYMPADAPLPGPQPLSYLAAKQSFRAFGIPITPFDDALNVNPYPLMRVVARDAATNALLAYLDVVVPVSGETDCQSCHATGAIAAQDPAVTWSNAPDLEVQAKRNVLILHDLNQGTNLIAKQPVLCASCHLSPPLELAGPPPVNPPGSGLSAGKAHRTGAHSPGHLGQPKPMSTVMHAYHGALVGPSGQRVFPPGGSALDTCYKCHPGAITQCLRGAMATGGMECFDCHGDMLAVGGAFPLLPGGSIDGQADGEARRSWKDVPRCQSCHTGDALSHLSGADLVAAPDGIRLRQAWRIGDPSASPIRAVNQRFAENPNHSYKGSRGHGGLSCESCHGSTHAEWPNADPAHNDNVAAIQVQGHAGPLIECSACHATLGGAAGGPHGLHRVNSAAFVHDHDHYWESNPASCQACHGIGLTGTVLSRAAADRTFVVEGQNVFLPKGVPVRCDTCHEMP